MENSNTLLQNGTTNRLIGWLISYSMDENGKSIEIREGRSFVSASPLKEQKTIVIEDETISAPHLAINAVDENSFYAVDIFSKEGSYIKKSGTKEEQKISAPVLIEHGDWLKVGGCSFQVCLIDGSSR
jgi:hypothetical protein